MPAINKTSGQVAETVDYNYPQAQAQEQLGTGEDGYGYPASYSIPVRRRTRITTSTAVDLWLDLNDIYTHLQDETTSTQLPQFQDLITANFFNEMAGLSDWNIDPVRRWTCHPNQYVLDDTTSTVTPRLFGTSSVRTLAWGISDNEIDHQVAVRWPTRLQARYYFNLGNYLVWRPYYTVENTATVFNDLDQEWANWIRWHNATQEWRYTREEFINYSSTTTVYTSGTLSMTVLAEKESNERRVNITVTYRNSDSPLLLITPTVAGYIILT